MLTKLSTETLIADGKVWRRKVSTRAQRAVRLGHQIPDKLLHISSATTVAQMASQVEEMLRLFSDHKADIPGAGAADLIKEGQTLVATLTADEALHNVKRLKDLPAAVAKFYALKGTLYTALKVINDAGRELHAASHADAAKYSLSVLHRKPTHHAKPASQPAPVSGAKT